MWGPSCFELPRNFQVAQDHEICSTVPLILREQVGPSSGHTCIQTRLYVSKHLQRMHGASSIYPHPFHPCIKAKTKNEVDFGS